MARETSVVKAMRADLLSRINEITERGRLWLSDGDVEPSEKATRIAKLLGTIRTFNQPQKNDLARVCSEVIGAPIRLGQANKNYIAGLFVQKSDYDDGPFLTVHGIRDPGGDGRFSEYDSFDLHGDEIELGSWTKNDRLATVAEIEKFINASGKKVLSLLDDALSDDPEEDEEEEEEQEDDAEYDGEQSDDEEE